MFGVFLGGCEKGGRKVERERPWLGVGGVVRCPPARMSRGAQEGGKKVRPNSEKGGKKLRHTEISSHVFLSPRVLFNETVLGFLHHHLLLRPLLRRLHLIS